MKLETINGWSICPECSTKFANTDGSLPDCGCTDPDSSQDYDGESFHCQHGSGFTACPFCSGS
jgi:hypothetical protein